MKEIFWLHQLQQRKVVNKKWYSRKQFVNSCQENLCSNCLWPANFISRNVPKKRNSNKGKKIYIYMHNHSPWNSQICGHPGSIPTSSMALGVTAFWVSLSFLICKTLLIRSSTSFSYEYWDGVYQLLSAHVLNKWQWYNITNVSPAAGKWLLSLFDRSNWWNSTCLLTLLFIKNRK